MRHVIVTPPMHQSICQHLGFKIGFFGENTGKGIFIKAKQLQNFLEFHGISEILYGISKLFRSCFTLVYICHQWFEKNHCLQKLHFLTEIKFLFLFMYTNFYFAIIEDTTLLFIWIASFILTKK